MHASNLESLAKIQRVTLLGMLLDLLLGVLKIVVGLLAFSQALIADGIHSLSDALTDIFVIIMTRIARAGPDDNHPYGHARFETLGTVILGISLVVIAFVLGYNNLLGLILAKTAQVPGWPVILVACASIVSKEWIFRYTRKYGEALRSDLLIANAWHSRTDAISSLVVLIGVIGAIAGFPWLDRVAAVVVAIIIAKIGFDFVREGLAELVDTGLEPDQIQAIRNKIAQIPGVQGVHDLRTRKMGPDVYLDVHILVAAKISVSEGHQIGEWVMKGLLEEFDYIRDVTYHVDPEDDSTGREHQSLPLRGEALETLADAWQAVLSAEQIERMQLHYLGNEVCAELFLTAATIATIKLPKAELQQHLNEAADGLSWFGGVTVWVGIEDAH